MMQPSTAFLEALPAGHAPAAFSQAVRDRGPRLKLGLAHAPPQPRLRRERPSPLASVRP
jgi:hypothetical protein